MYRVFVVCVLTAAVWVPDSWADHWVAIASYKSADNAEKAVRKLEEEFFDLTTTELVTVGSESYYRLLHGPFADRAAANAQKSLVQSRGYSDAWIWTGSSLNSSSYQSTDGGDEYEAELAYESEIDSELNFEVGNASELSATPNLATATPPGYELNKLRKVETDVEPRRSKFGGQFGTDITARLKLFSTASLLPENDLQRQLQGTPALDHSADLRIMLKQDLGPVRLLVDHSTVALGGDSSALNLGLDSAVDQTVTNDRNRRWNWTWDIEDGDRHQSFHRLDRLALKWQSSQWGVTVGREAVSWGNGIVFQPMDIFSPFSPTVVDRDYKAGDDLILIDRLLGNGQDLQLLHVARRGMSGNGSDNASSSALKWHGYVGPVEFDVVGARHYDSDIFAAATRFPIGQALVRVDVVAAEDLDGNQVFSGVINGDVTFLVADRNAYAFVEYFHNGWGVSELPDSIVGLPLDLQVRLARGELFNVMKNYVAAGVSYEWHPLINHTATVITNLHDNSALFQTGVSFTPGDNQTMQLGWVEPFGSPGDEFGGLPLAGRAITTGGASRVYFRWVYYL
ncbi:MAG: hypothetical protein GKR90_07955 [Pseudomonadales bacterium]|nr:hypothetical protein [Pseudomonadales bacterium]